MLIKSKLARYRGLEQIWDVWVWRPKTTLIYIYICYTLYTTKLYQLVENNIQDATKLHFQVFCIKEKIQDCHYW